MDNFQANIREKENMPIELVIKFLWVKYLINLHLTTYVETEHA